MANPEALPLMTVPSAFRRKIVPAKARSRLPEGVNAEIGRVPCSTLDLKSVGRRGPSSRPLRWLLGFCPDLPVDTSAANAIRPPFPRTPTEFRGMTAPWRHPRAKSRRRLIRKRRWAMRQLRWSRLRSIRLRSRPVEPWRSLLPLRVPLLGVALPRPRPVPSSSSHVRRAPRSSSTSDWSEAHRCRSRRWPPARMACASPCPSTAPGRPR
jgi:hypothetical protein